MTTRRNALRATGRGRIAAWIVALGWVLAAPASAQPVAIEQHTEKPPAAEQFQEDVTSLNASFGGSINTGNTEAWQLNTGAAFALVRDRHGFQLTMDFAYGRANVKDDATDALVDTVRSFRSKARYDFFLTQADAIFTSAGYRWDTFAGLDARVQGQLGYMRNLFQRPNHRGWGELGYDLTYDNYDPDPLPDPANPGAFLDGDDVVHSARAFLGYENKLNAALSYVTGLEGLLNVQDTDDLRVNWDNALRSAISNHFQFEAKFILQLDTQPVPGARKVDTATLLNLIYTMI